MVVFAGNFSDYLQIQNTIRRDQNSLRSDRLIPANIVFSDNQEVPAARQMPERVYQHSRMHAYLQTRAIYAYYVYAAKEIKS